MKRLLLLLFISTLFTPSAGEGDLLLPSFPLVDGQTLVSSGGYFELGFFSPVGSTDRYVGVWYHQVPIQTVVWVANRRAPISSLLGSLSITANGTLLVANEMSTVVWSSTWTTSRNGSVVNPVGQLLDNGNFVVREVSSSSNDPDSFAWQSFEDPTDTILPDMEFGWKRALGGERNLTSWTNASDPAPGDYTCAMDIHGYPEMFLYGASQLPLWRSGPWNGLRLSGIPDMVNLSNIFVFDFVINADKVYYVFHVLDPNVFFRITLNSSGVSQGQVWIAKQSVWSIFSFDPKDQCDAVSPCGPNGVCSTNNSPICSCLQGFAPKNPTNWDLRDGADGCLRRTPLDCRNGTDGFAVVSDTKLPDTSNSTADLTLSLEQCRAKCLSNCSCTAYASANISSGIGCIFWYTALSDLRVYTNGGQDLYVRLAAADLASSSNSKTKHIATGLIAAGAVVAAAVLILALVGLFVFKRRRRKTIRAPSMVVSISEHLGECGDGEDLDLPLFDLATIVEATDNFHKDNMLGKGGFGPVYKGKLGEKLIAVKRLATTSVQGTDEFKTEVKLIAKLQHRNLVRLIGCCIEGEERMLMYEFMVNKSLDGFLFDKEKSTLLDWQKRYNIILGIARGLVYLHHDSIFRVIHRDLKASNILLDSDMNPKISDFGMARIFGGDETEANNTLRVVGTYGYMSPEYAMDGVFSVKSDVFSFGVLVLEIISGKRNRIYSENHVNLLGNAWSSWTEGSASAVVDKSMGYSYSMTEVLKCMKIALLCVQEHPEDRPTMSSVFVMLGCDGSQIPQPKQPGFAASKGPSESISISSVHNSFTVNDITMTSLDAR